MKLKVTDTVIAVILISLVLTVMVSGKEEEIQTCFDRHTIADYSGDVPAQPTVRRALDVQVIQGTHYAVVNTGRGARIFDLAFRRQVSAVQLVCDGLGCHYPLPADYELVIRAMSVIPDYIYLGSNWGASLCKISWISGGPKIGPCTCLTLGQGEGAYLYEQSGVTYLVSSVLPDCSSDLCRYVVSGLSLTKVNDMMYISAKSKFAYLMPDDTVMPPETEKAVPTGTLGGVRGSDGWHYLSTVAGAVIRHRDATCEVVFDMHANPSRNGRTLATDGDLLYTTSIRGLETWQLTDGGPVLVRRAQDSVYGRVAAGDGVLFEARSEPLLADLSVDGTSIPWEQSTYKYQASYGSDVWDGQLVLAGYSVLLLYDLEDCMGIFSDGFENGDTSKWSEVLS